MNFIARLMTHLIFCCVITLLLVACNSSDASELKQVSEPTIELDFENKVYWAATGAIVPIPDDFSHLIHDGYELRLTNIADAEEFPETYAPDQMGIEFITIRFGSALDSDASISEAMQFVAERVLTITEPTISTLTINGRAAASVYGTASDGESSIYAIIMKPHEDSSLYGLMGIEHHPDTDIANLVEIAPALTAAAFFPQADAAPFGERMTVADYEVIVPEGWRTIEREDTLIAMTNIPADRTPTTIPEDLQAGDMLVSVIRLDLTGNMMNRKDAAMDYGGESSSTFNWDVGEREVEGVRYDQGGDTHQLHMLDRVANPDGYTMLEVYAVGVSRAELRTQLRSIIAGVTSPP